jgi:Arc/MetJ-type ribon-helix-helix transcriptional regulator
MAREKKIEAPVTLFASIETEQHEALRLLAFRERRSMADVVREALAALLQRRAETGSTSGAFRSA